jgi:hypothetical protein
MNMTASNVAPSDRKLVNKKVIAERYGVTTRTIQEWMVKQIIPYYKPGYIVRFDPVECDNALDRFKISPKDPEDHESTE